MTYNPRTTNGNTYRKIRERLKAQGEPCYLCGEAINYDLPKGHPLSFEVEHKIPVSKYWLGGYSSAKECANDINNAFPSHRCCNQAKGNKVPKEALGRLNKQQREPQLDGSLYTAEELPHSRVW